ncbi:MAG: hypothetical protein NC319_06245 [Butyricicoccus sp.]|nr:hypothetical protein [Butyricicoccus sp.]
MGIIGGQDGPTAIIVSGSPMGVIALAVIAVLIVSAGIWFFQHRNGK